MNSTRREFGVLLGAAVAVPSIRTAATLPVSPLPSLQAPAGGVSADAALAMLDVQGERGIYADAKNLDELRTSLARKLREHQALRRVPIPDDVQPLLAFRR